MTFQEYFKSVQLEYLLAEFRLQFYPKEKDRRFLKKLMIGKKKKILESEKRNGSVSIFSSEEYRNLLLNEILFLNSSTPSPPNFMYNEISVDEYLVKDHTYYFSRGAKVIFLKNNLPVVGEIVNNKYKKGYCDVRFGEGMEKVSCSEMRRVFNKS